VSSVIVDARKGTDYFVAIGLEFAWGPVGAPEKGVWRLCGETGPCKEVGNPFARPKLHSSHPVKECAMCNQLPTDRNKHSTTNCAQEEVCVPTEVERTLRCGDQDDLYLPTLPRCLRFLGFGQASLSANFGISPFL
jgi:hypothetical protein